MGIIVTDHVIGKRNHSLAREINASAGDAAVFIVGHASVGPMSMRIEDSGKWAFASAQWAVKIPAKIQSRPRFEIDLLDTVTVSFDFSEDMRLEGRFLRHGPQPTAYQDLLADFGGALSPFLDRGNAWEAARCVEINGRACPRFSRSRVADSSSEIDD